MLIGARRKMTPRQRRMEKARWLKGRANTIPAHFSQSESNNMQLNGLSRRCMGFNMAKGEISEIHGGENLTVTERKCLGGRTREKPLQWIKLMTCDRSIHEVRWEVKQLQSVVLSCECWCWVGCDVIQTQKFTCQANPIPQWLSGGKKTVLHKQRRFSQWCDWALFTVYSSFIIINFSDSAINYAHSFSHSQPLTQFLVSQQSLALCCLIHVHRVLTWNTGCIGVLDFVFVEGNVKSLHHYSQVKS